MNTINKDFFSIKQVRKGIDLIPWFFVIISISIAFFVFFYFDISDTLDNSLMLIDAIRKGQFFHYYDYAITNAAKTTVYTANYNLPIYILFAIWNIPFYIIKKIWGLEGILFQTAYLWCKVLIILATVGCVSVMMSILKEVGYDKNNKKLVSILLFSSSALFMGAFIAVQYDILTLFLILMGIDAFMKKREKRFLFTFMIAVPFKMFSMFIFIPLLLMKEKNILRILGSVIVSYSFIIIEKIIFWNDPAYKLSLMSQNRDAIQLIIGGSLKIGKHGLIIFLMLFIGVCVYSYMQSEEVYLAEDKLKRRKLLYDIAYIGFLLFSVFFITIRFRSYWIVLYLPFAILLMVMNQKHLWINIVLETIGSSICVIYFFVNHKIYSIKQMCTMLMLPKLLKIPEESHLRYKGVAGFLKEYLDMYHKMLFSVFAACMILLLIINYPKRVRLEEESVIERKEKIALIVRSIIPLFLAGLVIYASTKGQNSVMLNTTHKAQAAEEGIMAGNTYVQKFTATEQRELESLILKFNNKAMTRKCRGSIVVSVLSADGETALYQQRIGTTLIENKKDFRINLKGIKVEENQVYEVKIERFDENSKSEEIYPYYTEKLQEGMDHVMVNEEYEEKQLYMILR